MNAADNGLPAVLSGVATHFKGNGRKLGYPTANINSDTSLPDGVYWGRATMAGYANHPALVFVGTPTTMGDTKRRVEAHLLDITDRDYYDDQLKLELLHFYRPNQTFASSEELMRALRADELAARKWFASAA